MDMTLLLHIWTQSSYIATCTLSTQSPGCDNCSMDTKSVFFPGICHCLMGSQTSNQSDIISTAWTHTQQIWEDMTTAQCPVCLIWRETKNIEGLDMNLFSMFIGQLFTGRVITLDCFYYGRRTKFSTLYYTLSVNMYLSFFVQYFW